MQGSSIRKRQRAGALQNLTAVWPVSDVPHLDVRHSMFDVRCSQIHSEWGVDLANSVKIKLLSDTDAIKKMSDKYGPFYVPGKVPAGTYKDVPETTVSRNSRLYSVVDRPYSPSHTSACFSPSPSSSISSMAMSAVSKSDTVMTRPPPT